jgi:hypothetical protein
MNEDKLNGENGCEGIVAWDTGQRDDLGVWARVVAMRLRCADRRAVTNQQLRQAVVPHLLCVASMRARATRACCSSALLQARLLVGAHSVVARGSSV